MLSDSCYLTTLFYVIALFRIDIFIESSLSFSWSMSRVWFAQRVSSLRIFVFYVRLHVIRLDVCVEAINVSLQWTCHGLAMSVSLRKRYHLGYKTSLRVWLQWAAPVLARFPAVSGLQDVIWCYGCRLPYLQIFTHLVRVTVSQRCLQEHAQWGWGMTSDHAAFQRALLKQGCSTGWIYTDLM